MKITFLGTGTSVGVPVIGCPCRVCSSEDPRDRRFRSSIIYRAGGRTLLVDSGPDLRQQSLRVLADLGKAALRVFSRIINDDDWFSRDAARQGGSCFAAMIAADEGRSTP